MSAPAKACALRDFRRPRLWLGIWCFGLVLCVVLSLVSPPQMDVYLPEGDKLGHLLAYGLLSGWSVMLFASPRARWRAAAGLVVLGVAMEFAQGTLTSDRMLDVRDMLANAIGVLSGQLLSLTPLGLLLQRWDQRLFGLR